LSESDGGRTDEKISEFLGISRDKYHKILNIKEAMELNPKEFSSIPQRIEKGMSIEYANQMVNTAKRIDTATPDLPAEEYEIIVSDPPWKYDVQLEGSPNYKTMSLEEMKKQIPKLPAYKNCILFMWCTNPKMKEALDLIQFYEFEYKTNIVWVKQKEGKLQVGTGHYVKGSHELLLIATKGSPGVPKESVRAPSVVFATRTRHSEKPRIFSRIIEKYYPNKKKLEMFARKKDSEDDGTWSYWGDSVE
jgi:N6-adenosine-specific RNA methylase IME4